MVQAVTVLSADGATVVWLTSPPVSNIPARTDPAQPAHRGAAQAPCRARWSCSTSPSTSRAPGKDAQLRPDGIHLSGPASTQVAKTWLIPQLVTIWRSVYTARLKAAATTATTAVTPTTVGQAAKGTSDTSIHS